ncbi:MAG: chemotaxis protein CheD [Capsulimonadaceae bacterium]|nr:chemotaxis protein CheD [Capsulimonadaceae bacterium]
MPVMMNQTAQDAISVEMAEIKVSTRLTDRLVAYGLGACIGLCIYDPVFRIAGLAHIVLPACQPSANAVPRAGSLPRKSAFVGKFADEAVPKLIEDICRGGGKRENLVAAIVGGAHIFSTLGSSGSPSRLEIGARNVIAVSDALDEAEVPVVATDVGGSHGRTVTLKACDGTVSIRPIGSEEWLLTSLGKAGCKA